MVKLIILVRLYHPRCEPGSPEGSNHSETPSHRRAQDAKATKKMVGQMLRLLQ